MKVKGEYEKTEGFRRRQGYGEQDGGQVRLIKPNHE
jgi:hypothetical protein